MRNFFALLLLLLPMFAIGQSTAVLDGSYVGNMISTSTNFVKNPNAKINDLNVTWTNVQSTGRRSTTTPLHAGTEFNIESTGTPWSAVWSVRTLDAGLRNRNCEVSILLRGTAAGTTTLAVLDGATTVFTQTVVLSPTDPKRYGGTFPCGTTLSSYTVSLSGTGATTGDIEAGQVYVGSAVSVSSGAIVSDWQTYTPAIIENGGSIVATYSGKWRRVGSVMEINMEYSYVSGTGGAGDVRFNIPTGYSIDTSKLSTSGHCGTGYVYGVVAGQMEFTEGRCASTGFLTTKRGALYLQGTDIDTAGVTLGFSGWFPIVGWAATDIVTPDPSGPFFTDWVTYTPTFTGLGTVSATSAWWRRSGSNLEVQFNTTGGTHTGALVTVSLPSGLTMTNSSDYTVGGFGTNLTPFTGRIDRLSSSNNSVYLTVSSSAQTAGSAGTTWTNGTKFGGSFMVPISGWQSPFGTQSFYIQGPVKTSDSGTAIGSGLLGHTISSTVALGSSVDMTSGQYADVQSITLPGDGTYLLGSQAVYQRNSATVSSVDYVSGFAGTSGNASTGETVGLSTGSEFSSISTTYTRTTVTSSPIVVRLSGNTLTLPNGTTMTLSGGVVYHKAYGGTFTGGPVKVGGHIYAIKLN